ncbi:BgTH12-01374 [Blumeria graminis f. sp. triticale]|uniref:non-specific serine/threonine protein kinase n=1 Tax=Blumeria graminis f. sp. triticale TaxID=1689686 RepID=A0A9W4D4E6_BLUGR|nr:BgTH12-01374 [Blumeria graminis f. sp. triticale]
MCGNKSEDFVKISDLRKGLIFTNKMEKNTLPDDTTMATPLALTDGTMLRESKSTSVAGSRKRKSATSDSGTETGRSNKRSKTSYGFSYARSTVTKGISTVSLNAIIEEDEVSTPEAWVQNKIEGTVGVSTESTGEKQKSTENDEVSGRIKRLHLSTAVGETSSVDNAKTGRVIVQDENASYTPFIAGEGDIEIESNNVEAYCEVEVKFAEIRDRHSSAVATIPYGRLLHEVESPLELVTVLRDAMKAHWSLMTDAKILHRDISANNIIMTGSESCKDWKGYVIDLDLAVLLTNCKFQEKRQAMTGTMEFMALEVLNSSCETSGAVVEHSYRHDIESFFYVFLWQCLSCGWEDDKNPNKEYLSKWYKGTTKEIHKFKKCEIRGSTFVEELLPKFSIRYQNLWNLAMVFRKNLFYPYGEFYIGYHKDNNVLYNATMKSFDEAIQSLTIFITKR